MRMPAAFSMLLIRWPIQPASRSSSASTRRPGRLPEVTGQVLFGKDPPQHLVRTPAHRRHGGDAQALVDFGPAGIVNPGHNMGDMEGFPGHPGGEDVGIVTAGYCGEGICIGNAGLLEGVPVEADPGDLAAREALAEPAESPVVLVDDGHGMPGVLKGVRERGPHPATSHDHEVRHQYLLMFLSRSSCR
jgi:hypothetical protein